MKNVLVFPCGSEIGLEAYRSLSRSAHLSLYGGSSVSDHGQFVYPQYISNLPMVGAEDFIDKLNQVVEKHKIDIIVPAHDDVVLKLAQAQASGVLKCEVATSPAETCEIARSKKLTYKILSSVVSTPKLFDEETELTEFPVFLKPDIGQGSKGTATANSQADVAFFTQQTPDLLVMEYLPGKEYTVDCFSNANGRLEFCEGRERQRTQNGISVRSAIIEDNRFTEIAQKINDSVELRGVWFFQVKENAQGDLVLMEFAPRIAGTMGLTRGKGVNLILMHIFLMMGYLVDIMNSSYELVVDRALENKYEHNIEYKHAYIDFDDLLIFNGKVNPVIVAFIYQCLNKGIKVYLLTRHKFDLDTPLQQFRLGNIFDEIIWLQNKEDEKYNHITHKDAIFIDDSFAERKKVHDRLGIPTFDAHMVEVLIEKF